MNHKDFEMFYELYYYPLFFYALSLTKNEADAKDLVADTFVKALLSFEKGNLEAWLYTVLKNEYYQLYKKKKRFIKTNPKTLENIASHNDLLEKLIQEENKRWLYQQIYALKQPDQEVMLLSLQSDLKDQEIAELLNLSIENVRVIRYCVKEKLKKEAYYERIKPKTSIRKAD